jgi:putative peptide zinc metalloprotease protein
MKGMESSRVRITLPLAGKWLRFAQESLQRYSAIVGFSPELEAMCSGSVMEACEEIARKADEAGAEEAVTLQLDCKGGTVVIDITYSADIPLNPHETEDYEVPDEETSLDSIDMRTLWLHMIKRRMDRVRFMVQGPQHTLRLIKYRRDAGREKQAWVMTIRPELRKGVELHLGDAVDGHPASTLQGIGKGVLLLDPSQTFFVQNMDGKKSFHELYMEHLDVLGLTSPAMLAMLYERLEGMGMLAGPEEEKAGRLSRIVKAVVSPNVSIPNADAVVTAMHRLARPLCTPWGLALLAAAGLSGLVPVARHHERFVEVVAGLEAAVTTLPQLLPALYVLMLAHIALHELGHGVACKHFGGRVPRLGVMFYLASFIFYCDTSAAWSFPQKRQRVLVSLSGGVVSFAVLGAGLWCAGAWAGTGAWPEYALVAFSLLTMAGLAMNCNPFIKMDAYYILVDQTGIPNLRERSFRFLERNTLGWLGLGNAEAGRATLRERRIFWWYGILGGAATLAFFAIPLVRLQHLFSTQSTSGGMLLLSLLTGFLLLVRIGRYAYGKIRSLRFREYKIQ